MQHYSFRYTSELGVNITKSNGNGSSTEETRIMIILLFCNIREFHKVMDKQFNPDDGAIGKVRVQQ